MKVLTFPISAMVAALLANLVICGASASDRVQTDNDDIVYCAFWKTTNPSGNAKEQFPRYAIGFRIDPALKSSNNEQDVNLYDPNGLFQGLKFHNVKRFPDGKINLTFADSGQGDRKVSGITAFYLNNNERKLGHLYALLMTGDSKSEPKPMLKGMCSYHSMAEGSDEAFALLMKRPSVILAADSK